MNPAPENAFEEAVHAYQHRHGTKKRGLLAHKKGILELRAKGASFKTIAILLSHAGFTVSADTVIRFCRGLSARKSKGKRYGKAGISPAGPTSTGPQTLPHSSVPTSRGPRIANSKNV